jgi:hypothetical protein
MGHPLAWPASWETPGPSTALGMTDFSGASTSEDISAELCSAGQPGGGCPPGAGPPLRSV